MAAGDRKVRWFPSYEYNMVRVLERLAEMVKERGGFVEHPNEEMEIRTKGYAPQISNLKHRIEYWEDKLTHYDKEYMIIGCQKTIQMTQREITDLERKEETAPRIITQLVNCADGLSIEFELEWYEYAFYPDCNSFFPDTFVKIPVGAEGKYNSGTVDAEDKDWLLNGLFDPVASDTVIYLSAKKVMEFLEKQKPSERYA